MLPASPTAAARRRTTALSRGSKNGRHRLRHVIAPAVKLVLAMFSPSSGRRPNVADELKPCPFCGGDNLELAHGTEDREGVPRNMVCCDCGAYGPWAYCDLRDTCSLSPQVRESWPCTDAELDASMFPEASGTFRTATHEALRAAREGER